MKNELILSSFRTVKSPGIKDLIIHTPSLFHMEQCREPSRHMNAIRSSLAGIGYKIEIILGRLGSNNQFTKFFAHPHKGAAKEAGINL